MDQSAHIHVSGMFRLSLFTLGYEDNFSVLDVCLLTHVELFQVALSPVSGRSYINALSLFIYLTDVLP